MSILALLIIAGVFVGALFLIMGIAVAWVIATELKDRQPDD